MHLSKHLASQQAPLRATRKCARLSRRPARVAAAANPYQLPGRYGYKEVDPITNVRVGGDDELPIYATKIQATLPATPGLHNMPLVIMTSGFLLPSSAYTSYANHLASHGYAVVRYDLSEIMDDVATVKALQIVIETVLKSGVGTDVDAKCMVLFGHSRGAKLSCMLGEMDKRVKGMVLLDPVDNTSMTPPGEGYPSSLPSLQRATKTRSLPVIVIGAGSGGDIIPPEGNYKRFSAACLGPSWEVDLLGAGHLSFLDETGEADPFSQMAAMFMQPPSTPKASVSAVSKAAATVWLERVVCPYAAPSCGRTAAPILPPKELEKVLYDNVVNVDLPAGKAPRKSLIKNLEQQPPEATSSSSSSSSSAGDSGSENSDTAASSNNGADRSQGSSASTQGARDGVASSGPTATSPVLGKSYEELLQMRAKDLKSALVAANVKVDDCFEKSQLIQRAMEANRK